MDKSNGTAMTLGTFSLANSSDRTELLMSGLVINNKKKPWEIISIKIDWHTNVLPVTKLVIWPKIESWSLNRVPNVIIQTVDANVQGQFRNAQVVEETIALLIRDALHLNQLYQSQWTDNKISPMHK